MAINRSIMIVSGLLFSAWAQAGGTLDMSVSNESLRGAYDATHRGSSLHVSLTGLHNEEEGSLAGLGFHVVDSSYQNESLFIGVGGQVFAFDTEEEDFSSAIGFGGFVRYRIPNVERLSVAAEAYYAPDVTATNASDGFLSADFRVEYNVIPRAKVYLGYRNVEVSYEDRSSDVEIDKTLNLGLRLNF